LDPQREALERRVAAVKFWYHQIELAPGFVTPGINASQTVLRRLDDLGLPRDLTGKRVLDLGCRDGYFSFEAERRGASEVIGVDYTEASATGFPLAAEILNSRVQYRLLNVYDVGPAELGTFDVIFFLGLLYHLRNPMLAIDRIRAVQAPGGLIFAETQTARDADVLASATPLWEFFPKDSLAGDATNCWGPNLPGFVKAFEECEYEVLASHGDGARATLAARAISDQRLAFFRQLDSGIRKAT
jgi:tRNA (mo5U34)-methyltransferase